MFSLPVTLETKDPLHPNLVFPGGTVHSRRDPHGEAARFSAVAIDLPDNVQIIMAGIGWGYIVSHVPRGLLHRVIFFEPCPQVGQILKESGQLDQLGSIPGVRIALDQEELRDELMRNPDAAPTIRIAINPVYKRLFPNLEGRVREIAAASVDSVHAGTTRRFFGRWLRLALSRLRADNDLRFVTGFKLSGRCVLFCGAGPRLMPDLESAGDFLRGPRRPVIVCADTALAPILAWGLLPDIVVSVDAGPGTAWHFAAAQNFHATTTPYTFPVLTWTGGSRAAQVFFQSVYYYRSTFPIDQFLALAGPLSDVPEWANPTLNVSGLAVYLAAASESKTLFMAGADFLTDGTATHTRGTGYTSYAMCRQSRIQTLEMYSAGGYRSALTPKNLAAEKGLAVLSRTLGVSIYKLNKDSAAEPTENVPEFQVKDRSFHAHALLQSFRKIREGIDYRTLALETGASELEIEKWRQWIQNT